MSGHAVDFLRAPQRPRRGWVLLGLGIAAMTAALWLDERWASERAALQRAEQEAADAMRAEQAPPPPTEPSLSARRWQQAQGELIRPWLAALKAVESATVNPVFLLSLTIEPATGLVKLDGEAPSFDHAMAYVQVLDEGGILEPATLTSHEESVDTVAGRRAVKFSAVTHWAAP